MKIERLLCFQEASKYKSFSQAAEHLYISQSSLSKNIHALEEELGGDLFIRKNNNNITLSPFGEFLSKDIDNIIEDYNLLKNSADSYRINHMRRLNICTPLNVAHNGILTPLTEFELSQSNFFIETMERQHSAIRQEMGMRHADICFGYYELLNHQPDYKVYPLFQDPLVLVTTWEVAAQHNWTGMLSIPSLRDVPFCFPREDMEIFTFLNKVCRRSGFVPQLTHSDVRLGTIRQYISVGMRCTLQFESISHSKFHGDQFAFFPLENSPTLTYSMYVEDTQPKKAKASLVEFMLKWFEDKRSVFDASPDYGKE